jgi:hydrogenase maturation protease
MRILVYGYGNPGRQDDGLGIALVDQLEEWAEENQIPGIIFDTNYQLNIEDAEAISNHDLVIFADASEEEIEDFCLSVEDGTGKMAFTTHSASPTYILKLCQELFQKEPVVLLLHIKGYEWDFKEGISHRAAENLYGAYLYMTNILKGPEEAFKSLEKLKLC